MRSSLFTTARLRLLDRAAELRWIPSRIDSAASISPRARVIASQIHGEVRVADHARLYRVELSGPISIGANTSLWGPRIHVFARGEPVRFGNFCSIARDVAVHGYGHDPRRISTHYIGRNVLGLPIEDEIVTRGPTTIGHDVWVGAGVHILGGTTIGTGAVIGAGSVVARDVPPYAVAVGSPARTVRFRFDEGVIERLLHSEWWMWGHEEIRAKAPLFTQPLTIDLLDRYL